MFNHYFPFIILGYFMMTGAPHKKTPTISETSFLRSPSLKMTSPKCVVTFYYSYSSPDPCVLKVVAKQQYEAYSASVESLLWADELKPTNKWKRAAVAIGHRPDGKYFTFIS